MSTSLGIWLSALGTLALMSFAWRENPFYRFFEHLYIGIAAAHGLVMGIDNIKTKAIVPLTQDQNYVVIIPLVLGILLYTRFMKGKAWLSRFPISVLVGLGVGMTIKGTILSMFVAQLKATMVPLNSFSNIIIVFGTTAVLLFFYFTKERKGALARYTQFGRYVMMVAFGATFGNAVMGRLSLMIGRVQFLLDWVGVI